MLVSTLERILALKQYEVSSFSLIGTSRSAANVVAASFQYFFVKRHHARGSMPIFNAF